MSARSCRAALAGLALGLATASSAPARADGVAKKPIVDYGGRGGQSTTAQDVALFVPRAVFFVPWVVSEYGLRRPLEWLTKKAEKEKWASAIVDLFSFGDEKNIHIFPTFLLDFGLLPSAGLYVSWNKFLHPDSDLRLHAATWGPHWLTFTAAERIRLNGDRTRLTLRGELTKRQDNQFYGLGPDAPTSSRSRYGKQLAEASLAFEQNEGNGSFVHTSLAFRDVRFYDGTCCGEPSVPYEAAVSLYPLPPGFDAGYTVVAPRLSFALETRKPRPAPGSGFRAEGFVEPGFTTDGSRRSWVRYGGDVGVAADLTGTQRVLSLTLSGRFAGPLGPGGGAVPFTELVRFGGDDLMVGFLPGRLADRSGAALTALYRWPVWAFLDGTLHVATGNVFGPMLDGLEARKMRLSFGMGIKAGTARDHAFELMLAAGTETFEQGGRITSGRLVFGTRRGF